MPIARKTGPTPTVAQLARFGDLTRSLAEWDEADVRAQVQVSPVFGVPMLVLFVPETPWVEVEVYDPAGNLEIGGRPEWSAMAVDTREESGRVDTDCPTWSVDSVVHNIAAEVLDYVQALQNGQVVLS